MRNTSKTDTRKKLLRAMHLDDASEFRSILDTEGWPQDSSWSDYELLTHAIKHNHRRITNVLLDKKARIEKPGQRNYSLLQLAAINKSAGWVRVIDRLLSRGARVGEKNGRGQTALHRAFENGAPDVVLETLLKAHLAESSSEVFNRDLLGFVHVAATRPSSNAIRQLVGADEALVNWQVSLKSSHCYAGYTPLHFAVEHGRPEIAEFLLRCGADIHRQNASGSSVLHLALELRNIDMIDLILRFDEAKTNRVNNFGLSHFMAACAGSDESLVDKYLRSPFSASALLSSQVLSPTGSYPNSGYTPLHFAAEFGRRRTVELLLSRGADCCILTPQNISVHLLAHANNHVEIAAILDKQCHSCRGSTEAFTITRYSKLIEHDKLHGDVSISFEKGGGRFDSSPEEDCYGPSDVDIARLSHDDLVSLFVNESSPDSADQMIDSCEYDFLSSLEEEFVCDDSLHQYSQQIPLISRAPSNVASPSYAARSSVPHQFSIPIDNQIVFSLNTTASYPPNVSQHPHINAFPCRVDLNTSTLAHVSPFSLTHAVRDPARDFYVDFANQSNTVDSGIFFSNSSVGSINSSDSGIDDEPLDLSGFVPVATSTSIYNVPATIDESMSFN